MWHDLPEGAECNIFRIPGPWDFSNGGLSNVFWTRGIAVNTNIYGDVKRSF